MFKEEFSSVFSLLFLERLTIFLNDIIKAMSNYLIPLSKQIRNEEAMFFCAEISKNHV